MITIVIPVYNVALYVRNSLLSALNQTFTNIEYLLVDDCGNDESMAIVKEILQEEKYSSKNVKIIKHNINRGLSAARNTGLENATGKYVFFMDSDDEITPNCIELHYKAIQRCNADFTVGNVKLIGAKSYHIKPIPSNVYDETPIESYLKREWSVSAWNKLYDVDFLRNNNLKFKENLLHEDILWSYQISLLAKGIAFVEESTYLYKIRKGSIVTTKNGKRKLDSLLYLLNILISDWRNGRIEKKIEKSFTTFFDYWRFVTALQLLNFDGNEKECLSYYNKIVRLTTDKFNSIYSILLMVPFKCFSMLRPIYNYYKNRK